MASASIPRGALSGVIFDLWNTLAHHPDGANPLLRLAEALGIATIPGWANRVAEATMRRRLDGVESAVPIIERAFGLPAESDRRARAAAAWNEADEARLFPDVLPTLTELRRRGFRLGLLSNTQSFGLSVMVSLRERLDAVHLSCDTGRLKPEARAFLDLVAALGLQPGRVLMVGDHAVDDRDGARAAGLRAVLVRRRAEGLSHRDVAGDAETLESLEDLADLLGEPAPQR